MKSPLIGAVKLKSENRCVCVVCAYESTITGKDSPISCMFAVSQYN